MAKEPKANAGHDAEDFDGDFDLSGFSDEGESSSKAGERAAKRPEPEEPKRGRKIVGKPLRPDAFKQTRSEGAPRAHGSHPAGPRPDDGEGRGFRDRGSRDDGHEGKGAMGRKPGASRGGWEKLPDRPIYRGKDQGFVPRGPRNAGPRDAGPRGGERSGTGYGDRQGGQGYGDRGGYGARGSFTGDRAGFTGRGPKDFKGPAGAGGHRYPARGPGGYGQTGPGALRNVERAGGDHKPASLEIKPFLPLKTDKGRWKESQFLLEGAKNIADALSVSTGIIQTVLIGEGFDDKDLLAIIKKNRIQTVQVSTDDLRNLCDTETPQGILAVANFATLRPDWATARYVTLLDAVQDPGNVGAIMRTSLALGMDAVVMGKGTCDPYNPKVVRSSVGALMRLPFETGEDIGGKMDFLRQKGFSIVATSSHAPITLDQAKLRKKVAIIMGNEGAGTGATYLDMADAVVKIPLRNKVESLNVSVAHGILSYQLIHGRA
jgi:TrmH family RNA methyltransferase